MKNSSHYTQKVNKLYRSLKRKSAKVKKTAYEDPADAIVYAILSENMSHSAAAAVVRKLASHFIDWNDLRVARTEEILDVLGQDSPGTQAIAERLSAVLQYIFGKYNSVSLAALAQIRKRPAKQALEKINQISRFVVNYVMLTSFAGHAIPLTSGMIEYLRKNQLVHPTADEHDIEGFLQRRIAASHAYEFYVLLRHASEKQPKRPAKKKKEKTKSRTKKAAG